MYHSLITQQTNTKSHNKFLIRQAKAMKKLIKKKFKKKNNDKCTSQINE